MPWGRIFISHSTKTGQARSFLDAMASALDKECEVKLDVVGLQPGDDWRAKIYGWIDEAHAAVLVLTPEALKSTFVQIEVSILSWLRYRQPGFLLVPVLAAGIKPPDLKEGIFRELDISSIQLVNLDKPAEAAEQVIQVLRPMLKRVRTPRTACELQIDNVVKYLENEASRVIVEDLYEVGARSLGWGDKGVPAGGKAAVAEQFARDLLTADALVAFEAVELLSERGVKGTGELLDLLAPQWVKREEAKPVAELAMRTDSKRAVALKAKGKWARDCYLGRSSFRSLKHKLFVCELVEPEEEDALANYKGQIINHFTIKGGYEEGGDVVEEAKTNILDITRRSPVYVVFPPRLPPDAELLEKLRGEFETITFLVLTEEALDVRLRPLAGKLDLFIQADQALASETSRRYWQLCQSLG